MITIKLKDIGEIEVHVGLSNITLCQFLDFIKAEAKYLNAVRDSTEEYSGVEELVAAVRCMCDLPDKLEIFGDHDDESLLTAESISVCNVYWYYVDLFNTFLIRKADVIIDGLDKEDKRTKKILEIRERCTTLDDMFSILLLVSELSGNFKLKKKRFAFKYKKQIWYLHPKGLETPRFTVGEVATVQEYRRRKRKEISKNNDATGTLIFELTLHDVACICRLKNEKLPSHPGERQAFLDSRIKHFEDLPLERYFDICFFLTAMLQEQITIQIMSTLLKPSKEKGKVMQRPYSNQKLNQIAELN